MGSISGMIFGPEERQYLSSGDLDTFRVGDSELREAVGVESLPTYFNGEFYWSDELPI
jgi:hypothetical protein